MNPSRNPRTAFALLAFLFALASPLAQAIPQNGWWWNPAESGRGFFLEVQGPRMFLSGYFYAEDGRAKWLVSNDPMPDPNAYDGRLLAFANGQTLGGNYRAPGAATDAGPISLRFSDSTHGTLTWAGGTVPITRQPFAHGTTPSLQPKTGWWWNPDESGRGFSVEVQGDHMFLAAYMYDAGGNPVWYVADALMESPSVFRGALYQFANGQTLTGAYRAPGAPVAIGNIRMEFSAANRAVVTLSDDPLQPGMFGGKTLTSFPILPQFEQAAPPVVSAKFWVGGLDSRRVVTLGPVVNIYTVEVPVMTWEQGELDFGRYPAFYTIASGFAVFRLQQTAGPCVADGSASANLADGDLTVEAGGAYHGRVSKTVTVHLTQTCTFSGGSFETTIDLENALDFVFSGTLQDGVMHGTVPDPGIANVVFSGTWDFTPRF